MIRANHVDFDPNEYNQGLFYYTFTVNGDRCNGSWNAVDDPYCRICVLTKIKDVNLSVFNVLTRINELKALTRRISYICKCKFYGRKYSSNQL